MTWNRRRRTAEQALLRAFAFSLLLHGFVIGAVETGHRLDLWRTSPLAMLAKWLQPARPPLVAAAAVAPQVPPEPAPQEVPVIFVDVDPSQATEEVPADTPYYSAVSSQAANPDTSRDTDRPKLDGTQDLVFKTLDSDQARSPEAPPAVPEITPPADPVEITRPPPPPPAVAAVVAEPAPTPKEPPPAVAQEERPVVEPGDLAPAQPAPEPLRPTPPSAPPLLSGAIEPPVRTRPRTLAAAQAQRGENPQSALVGRKMAQEGGVRRFSIVSSLEVRGTPLGSYDHEFVQAVQQCWYALLEGQRYSFDRMGKVVLDFRLTVDGRITDLRVVESNVGEIYTTLCQLAITKPSPYRRWPPEVRRMVGADHRDVRFTFYY